MSEPLRLIELEIDGDEVVAIALPRLDSALLEELTQAERAVLGAMLDGYSNREIATQRAASQRTVANQAASIFRKFGVSGRSELAARVIRSTP